MSIYTIPSEPITAGLSDGDSLLVFDASDGATQRATVQQMREFIVIIQAAIASLTDSSGGTVSETLAAMTNIAALTDSSGGTKDNTVEALPATQATPSGMTAAERTAISNNFAELSEELIAQRALNTTLINAVASLSAKLNAALAALRSAKIISAV